VPSVAKAGSAYNHLRLKRLRENLFYERCPWFPHKGRVPHISLVFREMWDSTALSL